MSTKSSGTMAWNSSGSNNWNAASLNNYLNTTFYNSISTPFKELIELGKWYQGGPTNSNTYANNFYVGERTLINSANNTYSESNIGIINISDFLYASSCNSATASNYKKCSKYNWMYNSFAGTILSLTVVSNTTTNFYPIPLSQPKIVSSSVTTTGSVYPVMYLKSNVAYYSGDGSSANPYIIYTN